MIPIYDSRCDKSHKKLDCFLDLTQMKYVILIKTVQKTKVNSK